MDHSRPETTPASKQKSRITLIERTALFNEECMTNPYPKLLSF